jgi:hypothetical protein
VIDGVSFSSPGNLAVTIVDLASINQTSVEVIKRGVAFQIIFNGSSSVDILLTGVPDFNAANVANAVVSIRCSNVTPADLISGYYVIRTERDCSMYLVAMTTNGSSSCSLVNFVATLSLPNTTPHILPVAPL